MKKSVHASIRQVLDNYLQLNHCRKTPERYAILDGVCSMKGHFTIEELGRSLEKDSFRVSRATLYNALRLFCKLRLVVRHNLHGSTKYEVGFNDKGHCHQICSVCGAVREVNSPEILQVIDGMRLKRFRKDSFSVYIYGICSSCQAKNTRLENQIKTVKTKKQ
jgi:ferric uptake regulator protein